MEDGHEANSVNATGCRGCRSPVRILPPLLLAAGTLLASVVAVAGDDLMPAADTTASAEEAAGPPVPDESGSVQDSGNGRISCSPEPGSAAFIDRLQRGVYTGVCGATRWVDGLFGNPRFDQDSDEPYGRLGLFETWDRRDALDTRLRLRARVALPALENRLRLMIGRGDEQELVEERPANTENPLPASFRQVDDEGWLLGLGYSKQGDLENGFDFGAGARLRFPIDPYLKGSYRHNIVFSERMMLRFRETVFWRDSRGFGSTTQVTLDRLLQPDLLARWHNSGTVAEDTEALDWGSSLGFYQSLSNRRAISYTALLRGETGADVPIKNYGVETRYRQRITSRKWLFIELTASLTWPREALEEEREINPGAGIGFEMYFGPVPELEMR